MSDWYTCECGKSFDDPQSYNGHKTHCREHYLAVYGTDKKYIENKQLDLNKIEKMNIARRSQAIKFKEAKKLELDKWIAEQHKCEKCGKIMTEKYGSGRFCCRSCSNSKQHSEDSKLKTSLSLKKFYCNIEHEEYFCEVCGKKLRNKKKTGLCQTCLRTTDYGKSVMSEAGKVAYEKMKVEGKHHPWQSRNITSYAEQFWKNVLDLNLIQYQRELPVKHDNSNYFIDFYIRVGEYNIDLEIDGKQHLYEDRIESDKIRDAYLTSLGYLVYRIAWNELSSDEGKKQMEKKINDFLVFYNTLLLHSVV